MSTETHTPNGIPRLFSATPANIAWIRASRHKKRSQQYDHDLHHALTTGANAITLAHLVDQYEHDTAQIDNWRT